jgi:hypothetical protein
MNHLSDILHKSLRAVIPTIQPLKLLRQTLNITWIPESVIMKHGLYISCHLRSSQWHTPQILPISNTNTANLWDCRGKNLSIIWMPKPIPMKCDTYIMPCEAISMVYFINYFISNTNIAASHLYCLTDFITHTYYSFLSTYHNRYSDYSDRKVGD